MTSQTVYLTSFTEHNYFNIHQCWYLLESSFIFNCWALFCYVDITIFLSIYLLMYIWIVPSIWLLEIKLL